MKENPSKGKPQVLLFERESFFSSLHNSISLFVCLFVNCRQFLASVKSQDY